VAATKRDAEEAAEAKSQYVAEVMKVAAARQRDAAVAALTEQHAMARRTHEAQTVERLQALEAAHASALKTRDAQQAEAVADLAAAASSERDAAVAALREEVKALSAEVERRGGVKERTAAKLQAEQAAVRALQQAKEEAQQTQQRMAAELEKSRTAAERFGRILEERAARLRDADVVRRRLEAEVSGMKAEAEEMRKQLRISTREDPSDSELFPQMLSRWRRSHSSAGGGSPGSPASPSGGSSCTPQVRTNGRGAAASTARRSSHAPSSPPEELSYAKLGARAASMKSTAPVEAGVDLAHESGLGGTSDGPRAEARVGETAESIQAEAPPDVLDVE